MICVARWISTADSAPKLDDITSASPNSRAAHSTTRGGSYDSRIVFVSARLSSTVGISTQNKSEPRRHEVTKAFSSEDNRFVFSCLRGSHFVKRSDIRPIPDASG